MSGLWWLVLGILVGWLVELAIDYRYWRREAQASAARLARQQSALDARSQALDERQAALDARDEELVALQSTLAAKDAELLAQAKRTDERAEEVTRLEQAMDKRRADLDRMGLTLNEREKDIAGRNEALKATEADVAARQEKLQAAEADVTRRVAVVSNRESAMQNWEARILAREHELGDKEADLVRQAATAADLRASLESMKELMSRRYKTGDGADDLQAIEGIGPKIANLLHNADIRSFERLSETSLGELTRILEGGGPRFGLADPLTWSEQASCLVNGDYVGFEKLKEALIRGIRRDADLLKEGGSPVLADAAGVVARADDAVGAESGKGTPAGEGVAAEKTAAEEKAREGESPFASDGPLFEAASQSSDPGRDESEGSGSR